MQAHEPRHTCWTHRQDGKGGAEKRVIAGGTIARGDLGAARGAHPRAGRARAHGCAPRHARSAAVELAGIARSPRSARRIGGLATTGGALSLRSWRIAP